MSFCGHCGEPLPPSKPKGPKRKWCSERCRREQYAGECVDCGARTDGHDGPGKARERCIPCNGAHSRKLTREWILDSFREWNELFGYPPAATDWSPAIARYSGYLDWKIERTEATGRPWPGVTSVINHFGSWNGGLIAAGFEPLTPSQHHLGRHRLEKAA